MDMQLAYDTTAQAATVLAADGILDTISVKATEAQAVLRVIASLASIGFVLYQAISSRGAMARILVSGLAAGVFVWIVFNVTELSDRVDNEVNAAGVAATAATASTAASQLQPLALPGAQAAAQHALGV